MYHTFILSILPVLALASQGIFFIDNLSFAQPNATCANISFSLSDSAGGDQEYSCTGESKPDFNGFFQGDISCDGFEKGEFFFQVTPETWIDGDNYLLSYTYNIIVASEQYQRLYDGLGFDKKFFQDGRYTGYSSTKIPYYNPSY